VKFYDVVEPIIGSRVEVPESVQAILGYKKQSVKMKPDYQGLKEYLMGK
jgi:threonine synthase